MVIFKDPLHIWHLYKVFNILSFLFLLFSVGLALFDIVIHFLFQEVLILFCNFSCFFFFNYHVISGLGLIRKLITELFLFVFQELLSLIFFQLLHLVLLNSLELFFLFKLFNIFLFYSIQFLFLNLSSLLEGNSIRFILLFLFLFISFSLMLFIQVYFHFSAAIISLLERFLNMVIPLFPALFPLCFPGQILNCLLMILIFDLILHLSWSPIEPWLYFVQTESRGLEHLLKHLGHILVERPLFEVLFRDLHLQGETELWFHLQSIQSLLLRGQLTNANLVARGL